MSRVFISHASSDHSAALEIRSRLEGAGLATWLAPYDIAPGLEYMQGIVAGLDASSVLALLVTRASLASDDVRSEVVLARRRSLRVIPVVCDSDIDISVLPPEWEYLIGMYQAVVDDLESAINECLRVAGTSSTPGCPSSHETVSAASADQSALPFASIRTALGKHAWPSRLSSWRDVASSMRKSA